MGAPAGVVGPHLEHNHTTPHSMQTADAVTPTANATATAAAAELVPAVAAAELVPAVSLPQQHTQVDEACLGSGSLSKLQNRLRVEQGEFQLLRGEVDRLSHENELLAAMPKLSRPPRVGPATIMQHGDWYHLRWGLRVIDGIDARAAAGNTSAPRRGLVMLADDLDRGEEPFATANWWEYAGIALGLLLLSSFAACLVALLSISMLDLCVLELQGSDVEKAQAAQLRPLIEQPRRLLVTLLLVYVGASEALPVFLDKLMPDWLAILISATAILTLGEVLPQAFCTSPNKLAVAAFFSPIARVLMFVLAPLAWPLAWALDKLLGPRRHKEGDMQLDTMSSTRRPRGEQSPAASKAASEASPERTGGRGPAPPHGALEPREKSAGDAMTAWEDAFTLCSATVLDDEVLAAVLVSGCSRVPVFPSGSPDSVCGVLVVKRLLLVDPSERKPLSEIAPLHPPVIVSEATPLLTLFAVFQSARSHLAIVLPSDEAADTARRLVARGAPWPAELKVSGTVSVEDVFEELVHEGADDEEESLRAATQLATHAEARARLRRLRTLGTKKQHDALLRATHADDDLAAVRTGSGAPVTPLRTPLGRGLRKAAAVKGATARAAQRDLKAAAFF